MTLLQNADTQATNIKSKASYQMTNYTKSTRGGRGPVGGRGGSRGMYDFN